MVVIYIRTDQMQKALIAPFLCAVTSQPTPGYTRVVIPDGTTEPQSGLEAAAQRVVDTFRTDIAQGYKTKDKAFVVDMLARHLPASK